MKELGKIAGVFFVSFCISGQPVEAVEKKKRKSLIEVDDFAPDIGKFSFNTGAVYATSDKDNFQNGHTIYQLFPGAYLVLPEFSATNRKRDSVNAYFGMKYRLSSQISLSSRVSGGVIHTRSIIDDETSTNTEFRLNSASFGADIRLTPPTSNPFIHAFANVRAVEDTGNELVYGKTITGGMGTHWIFDPIVLSITGTYTHLFEREYENKSFDPGSVATISPSVGFAVNPEINLNWGMSFAFKDGNKIEGENKGDWAMSSSLTMGLGFKLSKSTNMNITGRAGIGDSGSTSIGTDFTFRF